MQVRNRATGEVVDLPDGTPDDAIHGHFSGGTAQPQGLAQSFMSAGQQVVPQLAAQLAAPQQQSTLPNIGGGAVVGLTPQQAQFTLQSAQQSNVDSMANKMRQQQMTQQSIESEADRAQQLKLNQQALKNQIQERKILADKAKFEAQQKVEEEKMKQDGITQRQIDKINAPYTLNQGDKRMRGSEVLAENPKTYAPDKPREITGSDFSIEDVYDPASGSSNKYSVNKITGQRTLIGPAPPMTSRGKGGSEGGYRHPTVSDSIKIAERIDQEFTTAKSVAEQKARAASGDPNAPVQIDEPALREEVARKVRRELGVSAFPDKESAKQYMDMQAEQFYNQAAGTLPPGALTPETAQRLQKQASNYAQVERWKADGYVAYIDPQTGDAVVETDDGKEPGT